MVVTAYARQPDVANEPRAVALSAARRLHSRVGPRVGWRIGSRSPTTSHRGEFLAILRPVVERFGIEIRTVGPLQCPEGWIEFNGVEYLQILKRPEYLAFQDRAKINSLLTPVCELELSAYTARRFQIAPRDG